jgi:hypothetical protein
MSRLKLNINVDHFKLLPEQINSGSKNNSIPPLSLQQVEKDFNQFERLNTSDLEHNEALMKLFPIYLINECNDTDWELFLAMSRYDRNFHSYVTGCFDNSFPFEFMLISFKHRQKDGIKWKTKAGTSPNSTPLVRIYSDDGTIYVVEGHRDALTAVLLGIDIIMIPYAGFRLGDPTYLQNEVKGRNVVFLVEDKQAYKCMYSVACKLTDTAKSVRLVDFTNGNEKVDLSDYVYNFNTIKEVLDGLRNLR